ncbi:hypothetical protein Tco_1485329 [Tanacetum coccineum]
MANQEQNPPQQEQPFVAAKQVGFNLKDILLNTNNEVPILYPEHNNKDYFKCVSDFISKCCLRKPFTKSPNMYKEYLAEFWYSAKALENSKDIIIKLKKKQRENVVPYTQFLSLLIMYKMKEGYGDDEVTLYPTQVFSVNNWALKPNQPEEPPFTGHMLAICATDKPVVFKALKTSSKAERVSQGTKPGAQTGHKKPLTSSKQPSVSSKEATKGGSSKAPTGSKTGHSKKRKESSSAMDLNPSQPPVSIPMDTKMHKEDQQATGGPTSLGSPVKQEPTLSLVVSASGNDASVASTAEADPGNSAPSDFVPQQQGINEGTKNTSYDHLFVGTDPHVLADQTKSVSEGLETVLIQPITGKGASSVASQIKEETSSTIKLEDLAKLVSHVQPRFKDLDLPEDDPIIVVNDSDEDKDDEVHATENVETKDTSVPKSSSPSSTLLSKCGTAQRATGTDPYVLIEKTKSVSEGLETVLTQTITRKRANSVASKIEEETSSTIKLEDLAKLVSHVQPSFKDLDSPEDDPVIVVNDSDEDEDDEVHATENSQKYKLELEKNIAEAEAALLKAQPPFPISSLPTELKDLPSKFNDLTKEVKGLKNQVYNLEIELPGELKEIPPKLEAEFLAVPSQVDMVPAKLKTLDALPNLLNKVTNSLNQFSHAITSKKIRGDSVPSAGQSGTQPAEGGKNTNQAIISQIFQRRAKKEHLNKQQPKLKTPPTTPIITATTTQMQSPFP